MTPESWRARGFTLGTRHSERRGRQAEVDALVQFERLAAEHDAFVGESLAGIALRFGIKSRDTD
jgi:hypothetical protein